MLSMHSSWFGRGMASMVLVAVLGSPRPVVGAPADGTVPTTASGWSITFGAQAVGAQIDDSNPRVLVVAVGVHAEPAARAFSQALASSGRVKVAQYSIARGESAELEDEALLGKLAGQPVDRFAIVRVFPGEPVSTLVTFYDAAGAVVNAIAAHEGVPLAGDAVSGPGPGAATAKAVSDMAETADAAPVAEVPNRVRDRSEAVRSYERQYLWFQDWIGVNQYGAVVASWKALKQGKQGRDVGGEEFYELIGRDDLLEDYRRRKSLRVGLAAGFMGVGGLVSAVGLGVTLRGSEKLTPGLATLGVGTGLVLIGAFALAIRSHPISVDEAAGLVEKYNLKLRDRLGLIGRLRVSPSYAFDRGGALVISGTF